MKEITQIIEESKFFQKFGRKSHWTSGSSTLVFPIENWVDDKVVEIQLDWRRPGIISSVRSLVKQLKADYPNADYQFCKWDGSCPDTMRIYY